MKGLGGSPRQSAVMEANRPRRLLPLFFCQNRFLVGSREILIFFCVEANS